MMETAQPSLFIFAGFDFNTTAVVNCTQETLMIDIISLALVALTFLFICISGL